MGFIRDIEKILRHVPSVHQSLLFSATVSKEIEQLSKKYLKDPVLVKMDSGVKPEFLQQTYYNTTPEEKLSLLIELLKKDRELALVFCNRKHYASRIARQLTANGVHARSLHGDLSQSQRERVTNDFRKGNFTVLVATDVAARGLHIDGITHVYNYEIPRDVESYTHRVGRTARAGQKGEAISLVATADEKGFFKDILFSYRGRIFLKDIDASTLPRLQSPPQTERRPKRSGTVQQGRQQQQQPGRDRNQSRGQHERDRNPRGNRPAGPGRGQPGYRIDDRRTTHHGREFPERQRRRPASAGQSSGATSSTAVKSGGIPEEKNAKTSWKKKWQKLLGKK